MNPFENEMKVKELFQDKMLTYSYFVRRVIDLEQYIYIYLVIRMHFTCCKHSLWIIYLTCKALPWGIYCYYSHFLSGKLRLREGRRSLPQTLAQSLCLQCPSSHPSTEAWGCTRSWWGWLQEAYIDQREGISVQIRPDRDFPGGTVATMCSQCRGRRIHP